MVEDAARNARHLHIRCLDRSLDDAFLAFGAMFCDRLVATPVPEALVECLAEFRRLLVDKDARLSIPGLLGELLVLERLAMVDPTAVRLWQGPRGDRHDFRCANVSLEVKTTLRADAASQRVRISSLDQLDPPRDGRLFLHLVRLEQVENGQLTIDSLLKRIEASLAPGERAALADLLAMVGIFSRSEPRFVLLSEESWEVTDRFPRLTASRLSRGCLDPGVTAVSYDLDLTAAADCTVAFEYVQRAILNAS